jgi:glycosyltransferase involved in cell wall biosynthesis
MTAILIDALSARQGGGQTYLLQLLARLPTGDPDRVYLLAPESLARQVEGGRVQAIRPRWPLANPFLRAVWERLFLRRLAARLHVHTVFFPGGVVSATVPPGCRVVTMFRNMIPFDPVQRARYPLGYQRLRNVLLQGLMLRSFLRADRVIFLSDYARAVIEAAAGRPLPGAVTIPHGISPEFRVSRASLPRPAWLPSGPYLLYVSTLDFYKAQIQVVQAFAQWQAGKREPVHLLLLGPENPEYGRRLRAEIARLGLADQVRVPGPVPYRDLPAVYRHATLKIFASESENCPNILLEAMAAGLPVACSSRPPMPEFGGEAVRYFDPARPGELAALLSELLSDAAARQALGAAAAQRAGRYDWDATARATWAVLQAPVS